MQLLLRPVARNRPFLMRRTLITMTELHHEALDLMVYL